MAAADFFAVDAADAPDVAVAVLGAVGRLLGFVVCELALGFSCAGFY